MQRAAFQPGRNPGKDVDAVRLRFKPDDAHRAHRGHGALMRRRIGRLARDVDVQAVQGDDGIRDAGLLQPRTRVRDEARQLIPRKEPRMHHRCHGQQDDHEKDEAQTHDTGGRRSGA